jgi:chromate transporter
MATTDRQAIAFSLLVTSTDVFVDQGLFFSGAAVVTFGGAYAVLAYIGQQAVQVYGWLAPGEMVKGLALAEDHAGSADHGPHTPRPLQ